MLKVVKLGGDRVNIEQLIELVTVEVLKRIESRMAALKTKETILIMGCEDETLALCQKVLEQEYDVIISNVYNTEGQYDYIILSSMDTELLANASIGSLGEKYKAIENAIMQGKPIYIIEEGLSHRRYKDTCNQNFYALLLSYEEKVQSFGMQIKTIDQIRTLIQPKEVKNKRKSESKTKQQKLITEKYLKEEVAKGTTTLQIEKGVLVTPLASDYAREHNIIIVKI